MVFVLTKTESVSKSLEYRLNGEQTIEKQDDRGNVQFNITLTPYDNHVQLIVNGGSISVNNTGIFKAYVRGDRVDLPPKYSIDFGTKGTPNGIYKLRTVLDIDW